MSTVIVEVEIKQIEAAIKRLKPQEKIRLIENLERETWPDRLKALLVRIDRKASKYPISEEEIDKACEEVRHKQHAYRSH